MSLHFINRPWPVEEFISVSFILCEVENRQTNGPSNDPLEGLVTYNTGPSSINDPDSRCSKAQRFLFEVEK